MIFTDCWLESVAAARRERMRRAERMHRRLCWLTLAALAVSILILARL